MNRARRWGRCVPIAVAIWNSAWGIAAGPSGLILSEFLRGSNGVNIAAAAADQQGNIYVVGSTNSPDFPITFSALQTKIGPNGDAFVSKFSPTGELLWSTFYGGEYGANAVAVAIDGAGNVVVAGNTYSPDFPVVNAYEPVINNGVPHSPGQSDAFLFKLDPTGTKIFYSTFLGSYATATSMALDSTGAAYVTGGINPDDPQPFPVFTNYAGQGGTFVAKLDSAGKFAYAYFYPYYSDGPEASGIAVDSAGSAYVASLSSESGAAVVFKLSPDGAKELYQTTIGPGFPTALAVDAAGAAYLTGWTSSNQFPLVNPLQSAFGARPLWRSTDAGATWSPLEDPPFINAPAVAANPANPQIVYAGTENGVFQRVDGGLTFSSRSNGIPSGRVQALVMDPASPQILYAGTFLGNSNIGTGAVYQTLNGGATWTAVDSGLAGLTQVAIDPQNPLNVYSVQSNGDVRKSSDGGVTWKTVEQSITNIALDPHVTGSLWAYIPAPPTFPIGFLRASASPAAAFPTSMLLHSTDGGATWTQVASVAPSSPGVLVDGSTNPSTIYAGLVERSTDGGVTWQAMVTPTIPGSYGASAMMADPSSGALYAAQGCAIYLSANKGQTWNATGSPDPVNTGGCPGVLNLAPGGAPGTLYATMASFQSSAFVTKLSPDGSTMVYSTLLRGHPSMLPSGTLDSRQNEATSIALDASGNMVVAGWTHSTDFPTVNAAQPANSGGADAFVAVISATGAWLNYSTYLGGSLDDEATALTLDPQGNLIIAGQTSSGDFPGGNGVAPAYPIGFVEKLAIFPPAITSVLSAASFQAPIEAGSWVMVQGTNLADTTRTWQSSDFVGNNLPISLDGVSVTIDGRSAFVEYISPTQINVQAPSDTVTGAVNVVVTNNGHASTPATAQLQAVAPSLFMSGTSAVASILPGYTLVTANTPAMPGDLVVLWGTGFGATTPPTSAGTIVSGAPATTTLPTVTLGGMQAPVISAVLTAGTVGLYQITIRIPTGVPAGAALVQASIGGTQTQSGVTLFMGAQ